MENVEQGAQRLVPFGCIALSFYRRHRTYSVKAGEYLPQSHLHGMTKSYTDIRFSGSIDFVCVVFQPAGIRAFLRMPADKINNQYVSLDELNECDLLELEQRLYETDDNRQAVQVIENCLIRRIYRLNEYDNRRIERVVQAIQNGETTMNKLAETACLGHKQFRRIFTDRIGANPKDFLQITRFQNLHHLLRLHHGMSVSQLADTCGYYDKSHLIKEVKDLSGFTPTGLQAACDPVYSGYHALFRSAFVDLPS